MDTIARALAAPPWLADGLRLFGDGPAHPPMVHLPLGLAMLMPLLALALAATLLRGKPARGAAWIVVLVGAALAGGAWLAQEAGETDEEAVEKAVPGIEKALHEHEEAAEKVVPAAAAVLGLALLTAFLAGAPRAGRWPAVLLLLASLATAWFAYDTGRRGGELVYKHGAAEAHRTPAR